MKFTIENDELRSKLRDAVGIIDGASTDLPYAHALLDVSNGSSKITASNLDTTIIQPVKLESDEAGRILLPAKKLFELVEQLDKPVTFEQKKEGGQVTIESGKHKFKINCADANTYPSLPEIKEELTVTIAGKLMAYMISKTDYAAPEKDTRQMLNSILMHIKPNATITLAATDGHRLSLIRKKTEITVESELKYIIPIKSAEYLSKIIDKDKPLTIQLSNNMASFETNAKKYMTKLLEGAFPDYERIIPKDHDKVIIIPKAEMLKAAKIASIMSTDNAIILNLAKDQITVSGRQKEIGGTTSTIETAYEGEELQIAINSKYLIEVLKVIESGNVVLKFKEKLAPVLVEDETDKGFKNVLSAMRT